MVNYCCVVGCGRNSRHNKHLTYYGLPKERDRQIQWLKAAGREDLINKEESKSMSYRVCSRHFSNTFIKNRLLCSDAVPTLCLQNYGGNDADSLNDYEPVPHDGVICNNCNCQIIGFRYKCITCSDYDLCQKCEMMDLHSNHCMIRIPKPGLKPSTGKEKWIKCEDSDANIGSDSSDDEPIKKYAKNYDSGVDLSEDVKERIRREVTRVLNLKSEKKKPSKKHLAEENFIVNKKIKIEINSMGGPEKLAPEFADVDNIESQAMECKSEDVPNNVSNHIPPEDVFDKSNVSTAMMPRMHLKLSEDLSELLIEVTDSAEKTVYKYPQ